MPYKSYILSPTAGRGMVTSRTTQSLKEYTDSFRSILSFDITNEAFELRPGDLVGSAAGSFTGISGPIWGIHYYNAIDPTNSAATANTTIFVHSGEATNGTGTSTLYNSTGGGTVVTVNGNNFTTTDPSDIFFLNIKNRCFMTGRKMGAGVVPTVVQKYPSYASYQWGIDGPTADMTYDAITDATNNFTKVYFTANGAGVTTSSTNVTKAAGANWDVNWAGKTVLLNDVEYTIVSVAGVGGPMVITPAYAASTPPATVNIRVQYGELSWPNGGPQYAYAYYNPTTGHISNVSPVLSVSEQTISNVRIKLSNIQVTNDPNYSELIIFRTALDNGGILLPLKLDNQGGFGGFGAGYLSINSDGSAVNFTAAGSYAYVDFLADSKLGQILGPLPAPTINNKPPSDAKFLAYWDQRVWTVSAATPTRLYYSGNAAQIPLGVPEESFPALNFLDIVSDDGAITGIKVVGTALLVATSRYLHFVNSGSGSTYRLSRVSSRGAGVDQYAFDEHPGDSSDQAASALYLARDRRLWRQYPGGRIEDIGWQIQDKLDQLDMNVNKPAIVKMFRVGKVCMMAVGLRIAGASTYAYFFYDFDQQTWHDMGFAQALTDVTGGWPTGWGNVFWSGTASGVNYASSVSGNLSCHIGGNGGSSTFYRLMADTASQVSGGYIKTQPIDMGDKTSKKTLQDVTLYVSDTAQDWNVSVAFDDSTTSLIPLTERPTSGSPRAAGSGILRYVLPSTSRQNQFHAIQLTATVPGTAPVGTKLYRIVVNYGVASTGSAGATS